MGDFLDEIYAQIGGNIQQEAPHGASSEPQQKSVEETPKDTTEENHLTEEEYDEILASYGIGNPSEEEEECIDEEEDWDENEDEENDEINVDGTYEETTVNANGNVVTVVRNIETDEVVFTTRTGNAPEASAENVDVEVGVPMQQYNNVEIDINSVTDETHVENTEESETPIEEVTPVEVGLLALNSPTLLLDESTSRFSGAEWYAEIMRSSIIVAGIGGIGSWTAFQLSRMSPARMCLYDDDIIEITNMSGQFFSRADVGKYKVNAIGNTISAYTSAQNIYCIPERYTENSEAGDIMICGFDNMRARSTFFDNWLNHVRNKTPEERAKCLFIDGRLSIDTLQVLCITGNDDYNVNKYANEYLFSDSNADATVCSMKQTTYLACMIGSFIVNLFTNFIANSLDPIIPYDLPFFTEYDAKNMIFKTKR